MLISFVVVASVFATATLSTGIFASNQAQNTANVGLSGARGALELKGPVIARVGGTTGVTGVVTSMEFQVINAVGGFVDLTPGNAILKYYDKNQMVSMNSISEFTAANVAALGVADNLIETGEVFEITILDMTTQLGTDLGVNTEFTIEMILPRSPALVIQRRTPLSLESGNNLN
mgnify:CR=1 FL=1